MENLLNKNEEKNEQIAALANQLDEERKQRAESEINALEESSDKTKPEPRLDTTTKVLSDKDQVI